MQFVHQRGVAHRDVKPGNLMIDRTLTDKVLVPLTPRRRKKTAPIDPPAKAGLLDQTTVRDFR